ncbi:MAG TPA: hypothetical protein VJ385_10970 [Fibrobacteria bacterium]|nr:hypothetical protein [Fibrobacteria bacterium]
MHPRILSLAFTFSFACLPARALNVYGNVIDKMGEPIAAAKVCVKSDASQCVNTDAQGAFHIQTSVGVRGTAPESAPYIMDIRNGTLSLTSPTAAKARVEWIAPGGRAIIHEAAVDLARGRNALALPANLPGNGVCFLRLQTASLSLAWKAVLMGSRTQAAAGAGAPVAGRVMAVSKAAAAGTLEISKAGFRTRIYEPSSDPELDALIFLSAADDVSLSFTGNFHAKVISIDRTAKKIIEESVEAHCDSSVVVGDTTRDTSLYAFKDGKLWLWTQGDCVGQVFTGTGTDPVGTWTLTDANAELPLDLRTGCTPDTTTGASPFESFSATYVVTETAVTANVTIGYCPSDVLEPLLAEVFAKDTSISLAKNTCKQVVFKNGKGESGTLDFSKKDGSLATEFTYKTTTCSFTQDMALGDGDLTCPVEGNFIRFFICMAASGFAELGAPPAGAKTSAALPMSVEPRFRFPPAFRRLAAFPAPRSRSVPDPSSRRGSIFSHHGWLPATAR